MKETPRNELKRRSRVLFLFVMLIIYDVEKITFVQSCSLTEIYFMIE